MANVSFVLDNCGIVTVPENKSTLAVELIQHFAPQWSSGMMADTQTHVAMMVKELFAQLNIPCRVQENPVYYLSVMNTQESDVALMSDESSCIVDQPIPDPITPIISAPESESASSCNNEAVSSEVKKEKMDDDSATTKPRTRRKSAVDPVPEDNLETSARPW